MMSSGVMAALQILVLPVKVRILARQLKVEEGRPATLSNRSFYCEFEAKKRNYELDELNEYRNMDFAAKAAICYEYAVAKSHSCLFATKSQDSICGNLHYSCNS